MQTHFTTLEASALPLPSAPRLDGLEQVRLAERRALAAELHDEMGQVLTGMGLVLGAARARVGAGDLQRDLDQMRAYLRCATVALRAVLSGLRAPIESGTDLLSAMTRQVEQVVTLAGLNHQIELPNRAAADRLSPAQAAAVFRALQEALTNVVRHAAATRITVTLRVEGASVTLSVQDDGQGFAADAPTARLGLLGMRERIAAVGGGVQIDSAPGAGTTVRVRLPLEVQ